MDFKVAVDNQNELIIRKALKTDYRTLPPRRQCGRFTVKLIAAFWCRLKYVYDQSMEKSYYKKASKNSHSLKQRKALINISTKAKYFTRKSPCARSGDVRYPQTKKSVFIFFVILVPKIFTQQLTKSHITGNNSLNSVQWQKYRSVPQICPFQP